jgi:hypothetical protein
VMSAAVRDERFILTATRLSGRIVATFLAKGKLSGGNS